MQRWLLKTEPKEYSFFDLQKDKVAPWDGVTAPAALKNMRAMKNGDPVFIYHTGSERAVVGTGRVVEEAYLDPERGDERFVVVDIEAGQALDHPVTLAEIKLEEEFATWDLVRIPRLSVVPVSEEQWNTVIAWSR